MNRSYFLYGNLTRDENYFHGQKYTGTGGSVYFMGQILKNLGEEVTIFSPYGEDLTLEPGSRIKYLPSKPVSSKTLLFKNFYYRNGRTQKVENLEFSDIPELDDKYYDSIKSADCVIVAPILNNISDSQVHKIISLSKNKFRVLLPQGFFRKIAGLSNVVFEKWNPFGVYLKQFNAVVFSDKDHPQPDRLAAGWSKFKPIVIVTKESAGCTIYRHGMATEFPAYNISGIKDTTGAGDIFAAALSYSLLRTKDIKKAASFANAAAGLSLRFRPNSLQYNLRDILDLIRNGFI